mmetsp:Transcript_28403/g.90422  ORF Transcript_28403/g.90422 Transcript_28403/m.90422 type:complete len:306 (-) Transcript_28403:138-1055(-)
MRVPEVIHNHHIAGLHAQAHGPGRSVGALQAAELLGRHLAAIAPGGVQGWHLAVAVLGRELVAVEHREHELRLVAEGRLCGAAGGRRACKAGHPPHQLHVLLVPTKLCATPRACAEEVVLGHDALRFLPVRSVETVLPAARGVGPGRPTAVPQPADVKHPEAFNLVQELAAHGLGCALVLHERQLAPDAGRLDAAKGRKGRDVREVGVLVVGHHRPVAWRAGRDVVDLVLPNGAPLHAASFVVTQPEVEARGLPNRLSGRGQGLRRDLLRKLQDHVVAFAELLADTHQDFLKAAAVGQGNGGAGG